jgi:hypothetical protein
MSGFTTSTSQPRHEAITPAREQELLQLEIIVQTATELTRKNGTRLILRNFQMPIQRGSRFHLLRYRRSTDIPSARLPSNCLSADACEQVFPRTLQEIQDLGFAQQLRLILIQQSGSSPGHSSSQRPFQSIG